jgi:Ca2+-binding EF-hand superfamily protein
VTDTNRYADSFRILDADEAATKAVKLMDADGDGLVSLDEFAHYLDSRSGAPTEG